MVMKKWKKGVSVDTSGGVRKMEWFMRRGRREAATIKYGEKEESELEWDSDLWKRDGWRQKEKNEKSDE